ncbi:hypothetical protein [Hymenobacter persicinus]|uniref:STAS/SEC14 domain-containing protein n=1 Tax=Hymenobacter persicinus TaxID=2025506 RepID=A0A4Q5LB91_9BACT|nr:hypothetical protein [Hymenobacter persicinus]RYU79565.1 hypothetical protein EWM57_10385 [Hymenobacter persicinus]
MPNSLPKSFYFQNPAITIYHTAGYLRLDWSGARTTEDELRGAYQQVLLAMKHYRTGKTLSYHGLRQLIPLPVQHWLTQEWIPRAVHEAGYSQCAVVESQSALGRLASQAVGQQTPAQLDFRHFATLAEAHAWLSA